MKYIKYIEVYCENMKYIVALVYILKHFCYDYHLMELIKVDSEIDNNSFPLIADTIIHYIIKAVDKKIGS